MSPTLSERITLRIAHKGSSRGAQNLALFLALRADIQQALADGWSAKQIWETLHEEGKVSFSYQTFAGYVSRALRSPSATEPTDSLGQRKEEPKAASLPPRVDSKTEEKKPSSPSSFLFNPKPNQKELL